MNLNHLKFAREVALSQSFTKAAKICCVTQPTLSNGIQQLEEELGEKIFQRTTRHVSLTPFGDFILPKILQLLDSEKEIQTTAQQFFDPQHKLLSVGFSPLADMRIIKAIVDPFVHKNEITAFYKECFLNDLHDRIESQQIKFAICPVIGGEPNHESFATMPLYSEPVFIIPRDGTQLNAHSHRHIYLDDIASEAFVLTPDHCGHAPATRHWFKQRGKKLIEYPGQAVSYQVMQEWANLGIASAILPWSKINSGNRGLARQLFMDEETPVMINFDLRWKDDLDEASSVKSFLEHVESHKYPIINGLHLADEQFVADELSVKFV